MHFYAAGPGVVVVLRIYNVFYKLYKLYKALGDFCELHPP